jgi:CRISPR-associated protein Csb1
VNHGNIPPDVNKTGGATIDYAQQTIVLSLPALRKLRFPVDGVTTPERDAAAQTVLAALALTAVALASESGFDLRSRCLLWPTEALKWELLKTPGEPVETFTITADHAISILQTAVAEAAEHGLTWSSESVRLKPSPSLVALLQRSQEIAATAAVDSGESSQ